jgi:hypothetical protein
MTLTSKRIRRCGWLRPATLIVLVVNISFFVVGIFAVVHGNWAMGLFLIVINSVGCLFGFLNLMTWREILRLEKLAMSIDAVLKREGKSNAKRFT